MSQQNSPLRRIRSIVSTYDRLADDPQARETFLSLMDIDHDMVAAYRNTLCDAAAPPRRAPRKLCRCRHVDGVTVTLTVREAR